MMKVKINELDWGTFRPFRYVWKGPTFRSFKLGQAHCTMLNVYFIVHV